MTAVAGTTTRCHATTDTDCSLKVIEFLVSTRSKVWANIQSTKDVCRCSYNLSDPRSWLPLFDAVNARPDLQLLNPPAVMYTKPSLAVAEAFEREIHQHLKDKVPPLPHFHIFACRRAASFAVCVVRSLKHGEALA